MEEVLDQPLSGAVKLPHLPSSAYTVGGEQRGTGGMTFRKISRIHAPYKVVRG